MSDILETAADAIDAARYAHPEQPRERPRPFCEADKSDREYAFRLARAALATSAARIEHLEAALEDAEQSLDLFVNGFLSVATGQDTLDHVKGVLAISSLTKAETKP